MINGEYKEGESIVRIKTDIKHPNPAVRDWPALRIIDMDKYPHPRVGTKFTVWPLYNFSTGIDDHLMGITHIIRGKEHFTNMVRQKFMYKYFLWKYPIAIHYGRLKIEGSILSKSKIIEGVSQGIYKGYDDPRLATILSLKKRGIKPESIKKMIYDVGIKPVDATLSWSTLYAYNKQIIDKVSSRYFAIIDKIKLQISGIDQDFEIKIPKHPKIKSKGYRKLIIKNTNGLIDIYVSKSDKNTLLFKKMIRLMNFMNICNIKEEKNGLYAEFKNFSIEEAKEAQASLIHWLPTSNLVKITLIMPNGERKDGIVESNILEETVGSTIQMERIGFGRIDSKKEEAAIIYFLSK
jgi:glutamyl-tRNA synthetase